MKTTIAYRLMSALVLPLLLLVAGCYSGGSTNLVGDENPEAEVLRVDCFMPQGTSAMAFTVSGAVTDEGSVEGEPLPQSSDTWVRYRMLQGEKGTLVLRLEGRSVSYGAHRAEGTFTILEGSGSDAYADLNGQGTFRATWSEERGLVEIFEGEVK